MTYRIVVTVFGYHLRYLRERASFGFIHLHHLAAYLGSTALVIYGAAQRASDLNCHVGRDMQDHSIFSKLLYSSV
jgi:hypothetical protein